MLPLIEIDKIEIQKVSKSNHKSHKEDLLGDDIEDKISFMEILKDKTQKQAFLDSPTPKEHSKSSVVSKKIQNKDKNFKNVKETLSASLKDSPKDAKELLEMANTKKTTKTIKDFLKNTADLKLNIQKISITQKEKNAESRPHFSFQKDIKKISKDKKDDKNIVDSLLQDIKKLKQTDNQRAKVEVKEVGVVKKDLQQLHPKAKASKIQEDIKVPEIPKQALQALKVNHSSKTHSKDSLKQLSSSKTTQKIQKDSKTFEIPIDKKLSGKNTVLVRNTQPLNEKISTNEEEFLANREKSFQETSQKLVDNLLKTETIKGRDFLEDSQFQKESPTKAKERIHQEIHQGVIHSQKTEYFNPQNTFLHFSDKLRNALHNYQPPITKLSLELNPESLGSVELSITKRGESIHVQISSNQQALQLFMQNAQEFKNQLNNLGFHDIQMDFKDNSGSSLGGGFGGGDSQHSSQQEKKRNENGLYIYQQTEDPLVEISHLDLSFSYDA